MKTNMSAIALTHQSQMELDQFIEFINELIDKIRASKIAVYDFAHNCKYCYELRQQRKIFARHINLTKRIFNTLAEKNQVALEMHYFRGIRELNSMLPEAEKEIKEDFFFPFSWFMLRELTKTVKLITDAQIFRSTQLYKDNSETILSDPQLIKEMEATWADTDEY